MENAKHRSDKGILPQAYHRAFSMGAMRPHAKTILPFLNSPHGRFVEVGARDGLRDSFTPYLEKALGWSGLLVEPWPHLFRKCRKTRRRSVSLNVAAVDHSLQESYIDIVGLPPEASVRRRLLQEERDRLEGKPLLAPELGKRSRKRIHYVATNSLERILDRASFDTEFDLLVLNLLGYEGKALEGMNFARYKPTFLAIRTAGATDALPHLPSYYERVATSQHDRGSHMHLFRFADFGIN